MIPKRKSRVKNILIVSSSLILAQLVKIMIRLNSFLCKTFGVLRNFGDIM